MIATISLGLPLTLQATKLKKEQENLLKQQWELERLEEERRQMASFRQKAELGCVWGTPALSRQAGLLLSQTRIGVPEAHPLHPLEDVTWREQSSLLHLILCKVLKAAMVCSFSGVF